MKKASNKIEKVKWLKLQEVAEILDVHPETLRRWDRVGVLKAVIINARGDRRYRIEDIEKFKTEGSQLI